MGSYATRPLTSLNAAIATGRGKVFGCQGMHDFSVTVSGIVAGDVVTVQGSNDGTNWGDAATTITADGQYNIAGGSLYLAANLTDISGGGSVTAVISGT